MAFSPLSVAKCGWLFRFRPFTRSVLRANWELRFFVLAGSTLMYFKDDQHTSRSPRGRFDLRGCRVEPEGLKLGRYLTFGVVDERGGNFLRLSTEDPADGARWLQALRSGGCEVPGFSSLGAVEPGALLASQRSEASEGPSYSSAARARAAAHGEEHGGGSGARVPMRPSTPMHRRACTSVLSRERLSYERHTGLLNLGLVIILAANFRLIVENLLKYGLRFRPQFWAAALVRGSDRLLPLSLCLFFLALNLAAAFTIEAAAARRTVGHSWAFRLNTVNLTVCLVLPCALIHAGDAPPPAGMAVLVVAMIVWMKLVSYAHCNADLRRLHQESLRRRREVTSEGEESEVPVQYPDNITQGNFLYYILAPTLCYQQRFPRTHRLRKRWLLRRCIELLLCLGLMGILVDQYIHPTIENSLQYPDRDDWIHFASRVLKLSLPCMYLFLCGFYSLFHVWLNILSELLMFGDREFYRGWWNATTIVDYWKMWNLPVHHWMLRTVYFPLLDRTGSKRQALLIVFFISAVFHEVLIGVPCHLASGWAFWGMLLQAPLMLVTSWANKFFNNEQLGNIIFWIIFCVLGQPTCLLLYYTEYIRRGLQGGAQQ